MGPIPYCSCLSLPASLAMTSCDNTCSNGTYQSCTLVFQSTLGIYNPGIPSQPGWRSTSTYSDTLGNTFYYILRCGIISNVSYSNHFFLDAYYTAGGFAGNLGSLGGWDLTPTNSCPGTSLGLYQGTFYGTSSTGGLCCVQVTGGLSAPGPCYNGSTLVC